MKWKSIVIFILIFALGLTIRIQTESNIQMMQTYKLASSGAQGRISYRLQKFTAGIKINGDLLQLDNYSDFINRKLQIQLSAQDQSGMTDHKIISVLVKENQSRLENKESNASEAQNHQNDTKPNKNLTTQKLAYVQSKINTKQLKNVSRLENLQINDPPQQNYIQIDDDIRPITKKSEQESVKFIVHVLTPQHYNISKNTRESKFEFQQSVQPTGAPQLSIVPSLIASSRAKIIKPIIRPQTAEEDRVHAVYLKQININKLIANIFDGINKVNVNKNAALQKLSVQDKKYQQSAMNTALAQINLTKAQQSYNNSANKYTQANTNYNSTQQKLKNTSYQLQNTQQTKQTIIENISNTQKQLNIINKNIDAKINQYTQISKQKQKNNKNCQIISYKVGTIMEIKQAQIDKIVQHRMMQVPARRKLQMDQQIVDQLRRQLEQAEKSAKLSKAIVQFYESQQKVMIQTLNDIDQSLTEQQKQQNNCSSVSSNLQLQLDKIMQATILDLNNSKTQTQKQLYKYADQLSALNLRIADLQLKIEQFVQQLKSYKKQIFDISFELSSARNILFKMRNVYEDAKQMMGRDKTNLEQAGLRFIAQNDKILQLTKQLENARAKKSVIDQQVNNLMRSAADIKLYSIYDPQPLKQQKIEDTTNSDTLPQSTNELKNIEQISKPKSQQQTITLLNSGGLANLVPNIDGTYSIKTMTEFILTFFGPSIASPSTISTNLLYSINTPMQTIANPNQQNLSSFIGFVLTVKQNSFVLLSDSGQVYQIFISQSARILGTSSTIRVETGMNAIIRGYLKPDTSIIAELIFCFNR